MNPKCPDMFRQAWIRMLLDNSQTFFLSLTLSACKHRHMIFTKTYIWFGSAGFDMKPCFLYLRRCFFFFFLCAMFKSNEKNYSVLSAMSFEDLFWKAPSGNWRDIPCFYLAELEFKRARETLFTLELHKDKRGQTFFNIEFGTYLALIRFFFKEVFIKITNFQKKNRGIVFNTFEISNCWSIFTEVISKKKVL